MVTPYETYQLIHFDKYQDHIMFLPHYFASFAGQRAQLNLIGFTKLHTKGVCVKKNKIKQGWQFEKNIYLTNKSSQKYYSFISLSVSFMAFGSEMPFLSSTFCDNAMRGENLNLKEVL